MGGSWNCRFEDPAIRLTFRVFAGPCRALKHGLCVTDHLSGLPKSTEVAFTSPAQPPQKKSFPGASGGFDIFCAKRHIPSATSPSTIQRRSNRNPPDTHPACRAGSTSYLMQASGIEPRSRIDVPASSSSSTPVDLLVPKGWVMTWAGLKDPSRACIMHVYR